jgi:hypothetical protein
VATQHRSKRARIKNQLRGTARALEDLIPADSETTLTALVVDDEPVAADELVPTIGSIVH